MINLNPHSRPRSRKWAQVATDKGNFPWAEIKIAQTNGHK